jgi:hypothetical protein
MFYACVQRFDEMNEKFLGGELKRALLQFVGYEAGFGDACMDGGVTRELSSG